MLHFLYELNYFKDVDESNKQIEEIRKKIIESYVKGKTSDSHYKLLIEKISEMYK